MEVVGDARFCNADLLVEFEFLFWFNSDFLVSFDFTLSRRLSFCFIWFEVNGSFIYLGIVI